MADLTADVDFSYLRKITGNQVTCLGPITQRSFLKNMGIDSRLQVRMTVVMSVYFFQKHPNCTMFSIKHSTLIIKRTKSAYQNDF